MEFNSSRRLFLRQSGLAAVAPIIAPVLPVERLVKYFFAPAGGWHGIDLAFSAKDLRMSLDEFWDGIDVSISKEALRVLNAQLALSSRFADGYDDAFRLNPGQHKIGAAIRIRKPSRYSS